MLFIFLLFAPLIFRFNITIAIKPAFRAARRERSNISHSILRAGYYYYYYYRERANAFMIISARRGSNTFAQLCRIIIISIIISFLKINEKIKNNNLFADVHLYLYMF